jgi:uncharacterized GH25 family protein
VKKCVQLFCILLVPVVLVAHDTWLVPATFRVHVGKPIRVRLATSEAFPTSDSAVAPERVTQFVVRDASGSRPVKDYHVEGNFLVAEVTPERTGHMIVAVETMPRVLVLQPKEFKGYLREEELKSILDARTKAGEADSPGRERYRKIAKSILCVGKARDSAFKKAEGLWLEIIPLSSPCTLDVKSRFEIQVLFQGKPLAGVRVGAGYEGLQGHDYYVWTRTDQKGRALLVFDRPGVWFVRVLHMVRAENDPEADWHSAFSTLTFEVMPRR